MEVSGSVPQLVRAALIAVSCDLPAGRKVCGFLSHSANLGCSRCYASFSEGFSRRNYANLNRSSWQLRTCNRHRADVKSLEQCKTKTEKSHRELQLGCRYSELLRLPYFDPVRMLLIDPMHCLFLGTANYITRKIWIGRQILNKDNLVLIEKRLQKVQVPLHIGRLPCNIDSGSTFTAEQWMIWTIFLSVYCLHGLLSTDEIECWRHFVLACRRLCQRSLSLDDVTVADALLMHFVKRIKRLYGDSSITPNMHMQCHLSDCVKYCGPLQSFWLFAFERYNGLLGNQPNNNRAVEIQLIHRFLKDNVHLDLLHVAESMPLFEEFRRVVSDHAKSFGSVTATSANDSGTVFCKPPKYTLSILRSEYIDVLKKIYGKLYPEFQSASMENRTICSSVKKFTHIQMNNRKLSSISSECTRSKVPYVLAKSIFPLSASVPYDIRPSEVDYFIEHSFSISLSSTQNIRKTHLFAVVFWPQIHPQRYAMGKPAEIWCKGIFEPDITHTFLPVENIVSQAIIVRHAPIMLE